MVRNHLNSAAFGSTFDIRLAISACDTNTMKRARKWITRLGYAITTATVIWVMYSFTRHEGLSLLASAVRGNTAIVLIALLAYIFISLFQALAWWKLMARSAGGAPIGLSIGVFALSQLGKYLPGNVMHFVFRYALTRASGASRPAILVASGLEPWLLLCGALGLLVMFGGSDWPQHFDWPGWLAFVLPTLALVSLVLTVPFLSRRLLGSNLQAKGLITPLLLESAFLLGSALLFAVLLYLIAPEHNAPLGAVVGAAILAWLAGFITPGSPGGLGVREFVLTVVLSAWIEPALAVSAAAAFRVLTVAGDLMVFSGGGCWWAVRGKNDLINYRHFLEETKASTELR